MTRLGNALIGSGIILGFFGVGLYLNDLDNKKKQEKIDEIVKEAVFRSNPAVHYADSTYRARSDSLNRNYQITIDSLRKYYQK